MIFFSAGTAEVGGLQVEVAEVVVGITSWIFVIMDDLRIYMDLPIFTHQMETVTTRFPRYNYNKCPGWCFQLIWNVESMCESHTGIHHPTSSKNTHKIVNIEHISPTSV